LKNLPKKDSSSTVFKLFPCNAITTKGIQCNRMSINKFFCSLHLGRKIKPETLESCPRVKNNSLANSS
jgi:hypothetical protein